MAGVNRVTLTPGAEGVSFSANIANALTTVYTVVVPDRRVYSLRDLEPLVLKLRDAASAELPESAEVVIAFRAPGMDAPQSLAKLSYRRFAQLTVADQLDVNKQAGLLVDLDEARFDFPPGYEIHIMVKSSVVAAEANSLFELKVDSSTFDPSLLI